METSAWQSVLHGHCHAVQEDVHVKREGDRVAVGTGRFSEYFQQSQAPCSCNQSSRPVCGTDGQTYRSPCRAKCSTGGKFRRKCWGPCPCKTDKTKPKCGEPCGPTSACPGE